MEVVAKGARMKRNAIVARGRKKKRKRRNGAVNSARFAPISTADQWGPEFTRNKSSRSYLRDAYLLDVAIRMYIKKLGFVLLLPTSEYLSFSLSRFLILFRSLALALCVALVTRKVNESSLSLKDNSSK